MRDFHKTDETTVAVVGLQVIVGVPKPGPQHDVPRASVSNSFDGSRRLSREIAEHDR